MSQLYTANCFASDHVAQTDMANIEQNLATLRSQNSAATAPSNTEAGLLWFDTSTGAGTEGLLKVRNDDNDAWYAVLCGTASTKLWMYRDNTDDGWAVDGTVTDKVLAIKGGSDLYDVSGGNPGGETWANLKAHQHTIYHNHLWYQKNAQDTADQLYGEDGTVDAIGITAKTSAVYSFWVMTSSGSAQLGDDYYTSGAKNLVGGEQTHSGYASTADVRPAAAVGTVQYPDI